MQQLEWSSETEFSVNGVRFLCAIDNYALKTDEERAVILKTKTDLEHYELVFANKSPRNALEFGIFQGGSPALFALWFALDKFVGIDICQPVAGFESFCRRQSLENKIRRYYGVSQADRPAIEAIIKQEFAEEPIDLMIDDASHHYARSKRTFEIAFPYLRPGGYYVIEDWGWAHWPNSQFYKGETALSKLLMELIMLCASRRDILAEIRVFPSFAFLRKSPEAPPLPGMRLDNLYTKRGLSLVGTRNLGIGSLLRVFLERLKGRRF